MLTSQSQAASRGRPAARAISRRAVRPARPRPTAARPIRRTPVAAPAPSALRLAGDGPALGRTKAEADPIQGTQDPRWVLAVRVAEKLEGPILRPEHRSQLVRLGRLLGLSVFDCNLVIAIVQDQARRGHAPHDCPTAGEHQLSMIPQPKRATLWTTLRQRPALLAAAILGSLIVIELTLLQWLL